MEKTLKEDKQKEREDLKARQEANKKKKEENAKKTEIVQVVSRFIFILIILHSTRTIQCPDEH